MIETILLACSLPLADIQEITGFKETEPIEFAVELIKDEEGFVSECYPDAGGTSQGYGHKCTGEPITKEASENIVRDAVIIQDALIKHAHPTLTPCQRIPLISFEYNVRGFVIDDFSTERIPIMLPKYRKSGGVILRGLERRRAKELDLFNRLTPKPEVHPTKIADQTVQSSDSNRNATVEPLMLSSDLFCYEYPALPICSLGNCGFCRMCQEVTALPRKRYHPFLE